MGPRKDRSATPILAGNVPWIIALEALNSTKSEGTFQSAFLDAVLRAGGSEWAFLLVAMEPGRVQMV
jgi:hypothetical protein